VSDFQDQQRDANRLRQRADESDRARARDLQNDVVIDGPRRLLLRSPGGTYFAVTVSDAGVLSTVNMGSKL
jgi:hypothetical protein